VDSSGHDERRVVARVQDAAVEDQAGIPADAGERRKGGRRRGRAGAALEADFCIGVQRQRIARERLHAVEGRIAQARIAGVVPERDAIRHRLISVPNRGRDERRVGEARAPDGLSPTRAGALRDGRDEIRGARVACRREERSTEKEKS